MKYSVFPQHATYKFLRVCFVLCKLKTFSEQSFMKWIVTLIRQLSRTEEKCLCLNLTTSILSVPPGCTCMHLVIPYQQNDKLSCVLESKKVSRQGGETDTDRGETNYLGARPSPNGRLTREY